jgi:putative FmdB family regulatory protein|tara:strand:+ start:411 stop:677 length:267 start_codon:yes stop_codon:yes gene_type:complete
MPIYEYKCEVCEKITEEFDKITSTIKTIKCHLCEQPANRIMSLGSFRLSAGGGIPSQTEINGLVQEQLPGFTNNSLQELSNAVATEKE